MLRKDSYVSGILFFDELPHYIKQVLEALREPLEDQRIRISRVHSKVEYPTKFLFAAAISMDSSKMIDAVDTSKATEAVETDKSKKP